MTHDYSASLGASRQRVIMVAVIAALLVFASSWLGNLFARDEGRISAIWIANGLLLGLMLTVSRRQWYGLIAAGFCGNAAANLVGGDAYPIALALALCNAGEVSLSALLIRRAGGRRVDLSQWQCARPFLLYGVVLVPLLGGLLASTYLAGIQQMPFTAVAAVWFAAHALGVGIVCPLMLVWIQEGLPPKRTAVTADWWSPLALVLVSVGVFLFRLPALSFLVLPPLIVVVFRHGHFGAVCGIGLIAGIAVPATLSGSGPFAMDLGTGDARLQVVLLQVFIAVSSLLALGAAMVLKQRRMISRQLAQAEQHLRTITDNIPTLIAHLDAGQRFRFLNAAAGEAFGVEPQSALGQRMEEVVGPFVYRAVQPHVDKALAGQRTSFEHEIHVDGVQRTLRVTYIPEKAPGGAVTGFYATASDITDVRNAEQRVARSEHWLQSFADNLPGLMAYIGRNGRFTFANRHFQEVLGVDPEALIGQSLRDFLGHQRYEQYSESLEKVLAGQRVQFEGDVRQDGRIQHYLIDWVPDIQDDGRIAGFFSAATNITARKTSELRQAASEARIRTMTDGLPGLIAYLDRNAIIRFCNGAYQEWFGIQPGQMVGRTMDEALGGILMQAQETFIQRALRDERVETEFDAEAKGRRRSLQATYLPHRDESGRVLGVYTLASDVTPLKRMQSELQQMARYDTLTGLANRGEFNLRLADTLDVAAQEKRSVALMFIDVDHFKQVNDTYGHATGDAVLQEVAGRLKGCIGVRDIVARLSGDEFVIVLAEPEGHHAAHYVARSILSAMESPVIFGESQVHVGLSIGVAFSAPGSRLASELLANADKALYQAKGAGRGTYCIHGTRPAPKRVADGSA